MRLIPARQSVTALPGFYFTCVAHGDVTLSRSAHCHPWASKMTTKTNTGKASKNPSLADRELDALENVMRASLAYGKKLYPYHAERAAYWSAVADLNLIRKLIRGHRRKP